jgi:integrase
LRWRDIDLSAGRLTIERTVSTGADGVQIRDTTKSGQGRTIAISAATVAQLMRHKGQVKTRLSAVAGHPVEADPEALVFSGGVGSRRTPVDGRPWRPESTSRRFRMIKQRAGVRADFDLHGLRHTMITEMLAAGVDPRTVMGRAGHRSQAMTMTVYAKVRPAVDAAAAELWGQILESKLKDLRPNVSR